MVSWHARVEDAPSIGNVIAIAREFVASLPTEELSRVPPACRPATIRGFADVEYWSIRLSESYRLLADTEDDVPALQELVALFVHAAKRIEQLLEEHASPAV